MCDSRGLRRLFEPKEEGVTGAWRKQRNQDFHKLYSSPNNITTIKSSRMRWVRHAARMGTKIN
jgi:hypothetical protein